MNVELTLHEQIVRAVKAEMQARHWQNIAISCINDDRMTAELVIEKEGLLKDIRELRDKLAAYEKNIPVCGGSHENN